MDLTNFFTGKSEGNNTTKRDNRLPFTFAEDTTSGTNVAIDKDDNDNKDELLAKSLRRIHLKKPKSAKKLRKAPPPSSIFDLPAGIIKPKSRWQKRKENKRKLAWDVELDAVLEQLQEEGEDADLELRPGDSGAEIHGKIVLGMMRQEEAKEKAEGRSVEESEK